jgi:hypothetical protein
MSYIVDVDLYSRQKLTVETHNHTFLLTHLTITRLSGLNIFILLQSMTLSQPLVENKKYSEH